MLHDYNDFFFRSKLPVMVQSNSQGVDRSPESTFASNKITENEV